MYYNAKEWQKLAEQDAEVKAFLRFLTTQKPESEDTENLTSAEKWGIFFKWADDPKKNARFARLFDKSRGTESARRILMQVSQKEKDWAMAESRRKFVMDYTSNYNAAMRKGRKEGYEEAQKELAAAQAQLAADQARIAERDTEIAALKARLAKYESV